MSTPYMDEASRCDRVALVQKGRILLTDAPAVIGAQYPRPLFAVRANDRLAILGILRRFPHAAAVWPFGEVVHYTDARTNSTPELIIGELSAFVAEAKMPNVHISATPAGIEDAFMWYMAQGEAA